MAGMHAAAATSYANAANSPSAERPDEFLCPDCASVKLSDDAILACGLS